MGIDDLILYTEKIDQVHVVKAQGNLNAFTIEQFLTTMKRLVKMGAIIFDMEELSMVTSQGIKAFKELNEACFTNKNKVVLINIVPSVKQAMQMGGIKNLFPYAPNEETAMKMASKPIR